MKGKNTTLLSVYYKDQMIFCTDAFPVVPEVGEVITIGDLDEYNNIISTRYVVTSRDYVFQMTRSKTDRDTIVMIHVKKA